MPKKGESDPIKEKYWRKQVSDLELSGLSVADFCRSRGFGYKNFSNRRKRLAAKDATRGPQVEHAVQRADFALVHIVDAEVADKSNRFDASFWMEVVLRNGIFFAPCSELSDATHVLCNFASGGRLMFNLSPC